MKEHIRASAPLSRLSPDSVSALENAGEWKTLRAGEQLFAFGDHGDAMYIVAEGRLEALIPRADGESIVVAELRENDIVGEIQLLTGGTRSATVRAITDARLIGFTRAVFDRLLASDPETLAEINSMILRRLRRNQLAAALTAYFGVLPREQLEEIEAMGEWVELEQGAALFRQGDVSDSVFVLLSGGLGVLTSDAEKGEQLVARVRPGELIGEVALLTEEPRSATIYAIRDAELVRFQNRDFYPLLERHPRLLVQIARTNVRRLRASRESAEPETATIVSFIGSAGAPLSELVKRVAAEMATRASVLHLDSKRVDALLEMPGISQAPKTGALSTRFSAWLSDQETRYRFILLETDATESNWTTRCIRQSDQVVTVGVGGGDPSLGPVESALYAKPQIGNLPKRLVLIHAADVARPVGTMKWLEPRRVDMHHHVRLERGEDVARLARFLSGSAVCLALGGGGARGFAHIGAYRALKEAGVPIDFIGGTSMGAVIGAEMAMGISPDEMIELNRRLFRNGGLVMDLTLPLLSLTTGKAYASSLAEAFGDIAIEDLWIPFLCVSSNISRAKMALHRTGLLRQTVRASSGVQGLFPPVTIDGDLHVDGALFSNLPADVMKSVCPCTVIAVDVTPPIDLAEYSDYGDTISGWTVLWNRIHDERFQSADLGTVMQRSAEAASMANQRRVIEEKTDFYLRLPVHEIKLMNFGAIDRLEKIGYETAKQSLAGWKSAPNWVMKESAR